MRAVTDAHRRHVIDSNTAAIYLDRQVSQIPKLAESARLRAWSPTAVLYSFDTSAILNGRRDLFRPAVFRGLWGRVWCDRRRSDQVGR